MKDSDILSTLTKGIAEYVCSLEDPLQAGHFFPSHSSLTHKIPVALGCSCFALKTLYTVNEWENIPEQKRQQWITYIKSFQKKTIDMGQNYYEKNAFIDPVVIDYITHHPSRLGQIKRLFSNKPYFANRGRIIYAETKQAIATLYQIGEKNDLPYTSFPTKTDDLYNHLLSLDWSIPWGAGGQAAAVAVFLTTQAPGFLKKDEMSALRSEMISFFNKIADPTTGSYFIGRTPHHNQQVNGAMKVLTALDWLESPIHYPDRLIDTCLSQVPISDGCHLVDDVYVLYRCHRETGYRDTEIREHCMKLLENIQNHKKSDGGFSYFTAHTQTSYYGVPLPREYGISDIHGTCLLTWALSMIMEILDLNENNWNVIKP